MVATSENQSGQQSGQKDKPQAAARSSGKAGSSSRPIAGRFAVAACLLVILAMCVFWLISNYNTQNLLQQQADRLGQTLAQQTANQLIELMLANDRVSMNVVLTGLTRDASVAEIEVLDVDNVTIAAARAAVPPARTFIPLPFTLTTPQAEYSAPVSLANSVAGYVRLTLDLDYIEVAAVNNLLLISGATLLLLIAAALLTSTYCQYLISFPANLLAFAISNIRKGDIETCPEPAGDSEISAAIRQFNATAEFLARNTLLSNFATRRAEAGGEDFKPLPGKQDVTLLTIRLGNLHYLASTVSEETMVRLLNKFYFFAGKVSQLYNGVVNYCAEGEVIINFSAIPVEEEQAFYGICAARLFLQLVDDLKDADGEQVDAKFKLAVHSGQTVSGLYSPITQSADNLTGKTLDLAREICNGCPDNAVLVSEPAFRHAGAGTRIEADEFIELGETERVRTYIGLEPMSHYRDLLERQAIQLTALYSG